jgi:hypothetical protein
MPIPEKVRILLYRGLKAEMPTEAGEGELLVTTDTQELFVGQGIGNPLTPIRIDGTNVFDAPPAPVQSVAGKTGDVLLDITDISSLAGTLVTMNSDIAAKAPLLSPALQGTPTTPVPAGDADDDQIATTSFARDVSSGATLLVDVSAGGTINIPEPDLIGVSVVILHGDVDNTVPTADYTVTLPGGFLGSILFLNSTLVTATLTYDAFTIPLVAFCAIPVAFNTFGVRPITIDATTLQGWRLDIPFSGITNGYVLTADPDGFLRFEAAPVTSVAGKTGAVTLVESDISGLTADLAAKVPSTRTVNGHALNADVTVSKGDVGLGNVDNTSDANKPVSMAQQTALDGKVDKTTTVNGHALSANVTVSKSDVGLGNADNTSDANKPVSTAQQAALDLKAPIASPTFTGTATAPTVAADSVQIDTANKDVVLERRAAGTLSQRKNGTAQVLEVYGKYTDASNYERWSIQTNPLSGRLYFAYDRAGTGTNRAIWMFNNSEMGWLFYGGPITVLKTGTFSNIFTLDPDTPSSTLAGFSAATSSVGASSPTCIFQGAFWNGSSSAADTWTMQLIMGGGTNDTSTLKFTHSGTSGALAVDFGNTTAVKAGSVQLGSAAITITTGTGSPEGVVTAPVGSLYTRTDGGAGTTLYVKESGTGNTGWVAK